MKQFTTITLIADDGMILTNGDIYGRVIALGNGDNAENYREITTKEYENIVKESEKEFGIINGEEENY